MITIVLILIVIGILLALANTYLAPYIDGKILRIINIFVVVCVVLWLLSAFGLLPVGDIPVTRVR